MKKYRSQEMPFFLLAFIGGSFFIFSSFLTFVLNNVTPSLVRHVNAIGFFDLESLFVMACLLVLLSALWVCTMFTYRYNRVLYGRLFKNSI